MGQKENGSASGRTLPAHPKGARPRFCVIVGLALAVITSACDSGSDVTGGGANSPGSLPGVDETGEVACSRTEGCTIELAHGAKLIVPGGALATDATTIRIETVASSATEARSHTYVLSPDGTRFATPAHLSIPIHSVASSDRLWCRASKIDDADGFDVFDTQSVEPSEGPPATVVCDVRHFSTVSVVAGDLSVTYRGIQVATAALDACAGRGFSSETACMAALSQNADCSYCGGHNDCWIPGGGGHCCPDESGSFDDQCWLGFQNAPVGASPDACPVLNVNVGFSTYDGCVNAGVAGIDCSYCGGDNDCWIPGGGGSCCPNEMTSSYCYGGPTIGVTDDGNGQQVFSGGYGGCWSPADLSWPQSACGGAGFWTQSVCEGWLQREPLAFDPPITTCQFCGGHNQCWFPEGLACPQEEGCDE